VERDTVALADAMDQLAAFLAEGSFTTWADWVRQDAARVHRGDRRRDALPDGLSAEWDLSTMCRSRTRNATTGWMRSLAAPSVSPIGSVETHCHRR
jgi:hypothetical protein